MDNFMVKLNQIINEEIEISDNEWDELSKEIIKRLKGRTYIVSEILYNKEIYYNNMEELYLYFKAGFEREEIRKCKVKFIFNPRGEINEMEIRHLYLNLCYWIPFIDLGLYNKLDKSYILKEFTSKEREVYYNEKIIKPFKYDIPIKKLNILISEAQKMLCRISLDFNPVLGCTINQESFMDLYQRNEKFRELTNLKLEPGIQPHDAEIILDNAMYELIDLFKTEDNVMNPLLNSCNALKHKQLAECFINFGFKPDVNGDVLPVPINTNLLIGGFGNTTNLYLEANSCIKSLLANKYEMGSSGHFSKLLTLVCGNAKLDESVEECNTVNPLKVKIRDKRYVKVFKGRNYRLSGERDYHVCKGNEEHLIGKTIFVKSPTTCTCHGDTICKSCMGEIAYDVKDLNSVGVLFSAKYGEPIGQSILSTKHLLTSNSEELIFVDEFDRLFVLSSNEIFVDTNKDFNMNRYSLILKDEDKDEFNHQDDISMNLHYSRFFVLDKKTKEILEIKEVKDKSLFVSPELAESIKQFANPEKDYVEIPFSKLNTVEDDEGNQLIRIFSLIINNNELTEPLYKLQKLLDSKKGRVSTNLDEVYQQFIDLNMDANINFPSIVSEVILACLIRDGEDILKHADFSKYDPSYQILTLSTALEKNPSVLTSISSVALGRQLADLKTYEKTETGFLDNLYRV